jgi:hypothetical protein
MRTAVFSTELLRSFLDEHKIATLSELKETLGTKVDMTVFRKLRELTYRTSYSHRGLYYTLDEITRFNNQGLWFYRSVGFSVFGNVTKTAKTLVDNSEKGMTAGELKQLLKVEVKEPLLRLFRRKQLYREKMPLVYVYFTEETFERRKQMLLRRVQDAESVDGLENLRGELLAHELKAAVIIFFSLLDEKQRRLYAGLESLKQGYGGDSRIAELLGLDSHTVAKGRQELLNQDFEIERVRREGGGRTPVKKKHRK